MGVVRRRVTGGLVALVATTVALALLLGWRPVVPTTDAMAPAVAGGSLVVSRPVSPDALVRGQVVTVFSGGMRPVTRRVVAVAPDGDAALVDIAADAGDEPTVRLRLVDPVLVAVLVVPLVGGLLTPGPLVALAAVLAAAGLLATRRRARHAPTRAPTWTPVTPDEDGEGVRPVATSPVGVPNPRVVALVATVEALVEDGELSPVVARDLVRVGTARALSLPSAEDSGAVRSLDDGGRFYVVSLLDVDVAALSLVPLGSRRQRDGSAAVDRWWATVEQAVPTPARREIEPWTRVSTTAGR